MYTPEDVKKCFKLCMDEDLRPLTLLDITKRDVAPLFCPEDTERNQKSNLKGSKNLIYYYYFLIFSTMALKCRFYEIKEIKPQPPPYRFKLKSTCCTCMHCNKGCQYFCFRCKRDLFLVLGVIVV